MADDGQESPPDKKPKVSRKTLIEVVEAKAVAAKEIKLRELVLEERRLALEEQRQIHQQQIERERMAQQQAMMELLGRVTEQITKP